MNKIKLEQMPINDVKGQVAGIEVKNGEIIIKYKQEKCVERLRWRAKCSKYYYTITMNDGINVIHGLIEAGWGTDDSRYNSGNYFKTEEDAQKVLAELNAIFEKNL